LTQSNDPTTTAKEKDTNNHALEAEVANGRKNYWTENIEQVAEAKCFDEDRKSPPELLCKQQQVVNVVSQTRTQ
jgi:hypothetical protein